MWLVWVLWSVLGCSRQGNKYFVREKQVGNLMFLAVRKLLVCIGSDNNSTKPDKITGIVTYQKPAGKKASI